MRITAIILNYKKYEDVRTCILSLEKQSLPQDTELSIVIIDNASSDESTQKIQAEFPHHTYIYNTENYGFSKGVNQGIHASMKESDYSLLVNDDAYLDEHCLQKLIDESKGVALVGPAILYTQKPDILWQGGGLFSKTKLGVTVPGKNKIYTPQKTQSVDFISGCVLLIPKTIIQTIGFFDGKFFFYGEDLDFCIRTKKKSIPVLYVSEAKAWHSIGEITQSRTNPFVLQNLAKSYFLIIKKHYQKLQTYGLLLFIFLYTPFRVYQIVKGRGSLNSILAWFKGGLEGYRLHTD